MVPAEREGSTRRTGWLTAGDTPSGLNGLAGGCNKKEERARSSDLAPETILHCVQTQPHRRQGLSRGRSSQPNLLQQHALSALVSLQPHLLRLTHTLHHSSFQGRLS